MIDEHDENEKESEPIKKSGCLVKLLKLTLWTGLFASVLGAFGLGAIYFYMSKDLPNISTLKNYRPPTITTVYSDDGRKIGEFYKERRVVVSLDEMPDTLKNAFIAAEDSNFYNHKGIDLISIFRAFIKNIEAGAIVQGGSTITQQVTKYFLLTPEKSYRRKIREAILAYRIEKTFSKDEILFLYLNQIYLGHAAHGVEAAAENYFGKNVKDLNLAECAMLAGLPRAPSRYSPFRYPERAKLRQIYTLNRMVDDNFITNIDASEAINQEMDIKPRRNWYSEKVPCYTEHVRRYVEEKYGEELLYNGGLKIYTAVNIEQQKIAREEVVKGLKELDKRQGYRGPLIRLIPEDIEAYTLELKEKLEETPLKEGETFTGVVVRVDDKKNIVSVRLGDAFGEIPLENMKWARKVNIDVAPWEVKINHPGKVLSVGDVIQVSADALDEEKNLWTLSLEQTPVVQAALLCIEAETGQVKVMIGGRDFKDSQFNRAIQSKRQPGSAFKPIVYAAAIDKGYTVASVVIDSPLVYKDEERDFTWKPRNYANTFSGPTLLRKALAKSRNVVTIKILQDIGIKYVIDYARKLGITSHINEDLSIALGSSGASLLEIVGAYSVFTNLGYLVEPIFITKIEDRDGNVLEERKARREKVIDMSTAYIITNLLESAVQNGTGWRIKALKRPAAGKTGTTNNLNDALFLGYTPRYITGTWVGFDTEAPLGKGETGSRAASPIWLGFMQRILEGKPVRSFTVPEGIVFSKIDAETGLLPIPESKNTIFECFKEGTVPTEYTKKPNTITEPDRFFEDDM